MQVDVVTIREGAGTRGPTLDVAFPAVERLG
jgi:hypothetical protein